MPDHRKTLVQLLRDQGPQPPYPRPAGGQAGAAFLVLLAAIAVVVALAWGIMRPAPAEAGVRPLTSASSTAPTASGYTREVYAAATGSLDVSAVNDTDWHTVVSEDLYDATDVDGEQLPSGLTVATLTYVNLGANTAWLKLRARAAADDSDANRIPCPANTTCRLDVRGHSHGDSVGGDPGRPVTAIAYSKGAGGDSAYIVVTYDR